MKIFYGEVHSHTNLSDGKGLVENAYPFTRDVAGVDYYAVTDHNTLIKDDYIQTVSKFADEYNKDGEFAALYGYEMSWGPGDYGHANIIAPKQLFDANRTLTEWYDDLAEIGETGVGQFNHPGERWGSFEDFRYDARMDRIFHLMELRLTEYGIFTVEEEFEKALAKGWHLGPVSNEDGHSPRWTMAREETGAVLAEELTRDSILDAMRAHRTYTTTDRTLKLFYRANGAWLGSVIPKTGKLDITVEASTEKACGLGLLQLVGQYNRVLAQVNVGAAKEFCWNITIPDDQKYVYVRRIGGMQYAMTAPVWVEQSGEVSCELEVGYEDGQMIAAVTLQNGGKDELSDLSVEWYPANERIEYGTAPAAVSRLDCLAAGESGRMTAALPVRVCDTRLVAHVTGKRNGEYFGCDRMLNLAHVSITQFFCNTSTYRAHGFTIQPFCCFDLYNRTDVPLDLSQYTLRYVDGLRNSDAEIDCVIPPHKTLTVWMRGPESALTLKDFNDYYGTDLSEDQVYILPMLFNRDVQRLKIGLMYGEQMVCRAWVRSRAYADTKPMDGAAFRYGFSGESTSAEILGFGRETKPGEANITYPKAPVPALGAAHAKALPREQAPIRHAVCIADGGINAEALLKELSGLLPSGVKIDALVGDNDGKKTLGEYLYEDPTDLLGRALATGADTVVISMGNVDVKFPRGDRWISWNFNSYLTNMHMLCGMLRANGKRILLATLPKKADYDEATEARRHTMCTKLWKVARSIGAEVIGDLSDMAIVRSVTLPTLEPKADAVRIACIGDKFSLGMRQNLVSPFSVLQDKLGEDYDVRIYTSAYAKTIPSHDNYVFKCIPDRLEAMKQFSPDCILVSFGNGDNTRGEAAKWDSGLAEEFSQGYREILCEMKKISKRVIAITPFKRIEDDDARTIMIAKEGGMADRVREIACELGVETVEMTLPTAEDHSLLIAEKTGFQYLSPKGNEFLANALTALIKKQ
ncbi:MAG: CehA/McbA family metallohydrolase [Clostridia bacterium]|nr:CehA/McbA family metallohydrolase [Clostridia bacterium]